MGAETAEGVNLCFHADGFAKNADFFFSVDEAASERAVALEADDDDVGGGLPEVVFEVVQDASGVAHSGTGHDEAGSVDFVDAAGLFGGCGGFEGAEVVLKVSFGEEGSQFVIEQFGVARQDACGFDGHGAIEEDGERWHLAVAEHGGEEEGEHLGAPHGEGWDEDVSTIGGGGADDGAELVDGF